MTVNIEFALPRGHGLGPDDGKTDCFEAEAGILRRRQCLELQIEEARHMGDAARRQREPDIDRLDCAIDAVERQPQCARAHVVAGKNVHEGVHQAAGQCHDRVLREDRLEQITQAVIDRRRHDGDERLVEAAECLIDTPEKLGGKTRGKGRARLVEERSRRI